MRQPASPFRLGTEYRRAPARGEDTEAVLRELCGYDDDALRAGAGGRGVRMTVKPGWKGRFFEDFEVGDVYEHPLGRTVLPVDNSWFTLLTQNTADLHFDAHYAAQTEWGRPLVDSTFTLALVTGQSVTDVSQNVMANLGWDEVRLPAPVFEGDTIYSESEVLVGARLEVAAERGRRDRGHDGLQPGRRDRHHLQAHAARLPPRRTPPPARDRAPPVAEWADVVAIAARFPGSSRGPRTARRR